MNLPGQLTNLETPKDQNGDTISDGRWYRITRGRGKPAYVLVKYQMEVDEFVCQPLGGGFWQRVDEMESGLTWERVKESEVPQ